MMYGYADLLVIGSGINEVCTAYENAKDGKRVVLATDGEYLLKEFSEALGGFFKDTDAIAPIVKKLGITPKRTRDGMLHVGQGCAVSGALKLLKNAGVEILFDTVNIGVLTKDEKVAGGVFANKFGVFCVKSAAVVFHKKQSENYFAFQLGNLCLDNDKTPVVFDDLDTITDITLNRDGKSPDIGVVSFVSDHKNIYEAFEKMIFLVNRLKEKSEIFKNCSILKTALTFERPSFSELPGTVTFDGFSEPDTAVINGNKYRLKDIELPEFLDERLKVETRKLRLAPDMGQELKTGLAIVGGGTGGASAYSAAKKYCREDVTVFEREFLPGGTRTLGMVTGFWHGYGEGFCKENLKNINEYADSRFNGSQCRRCVAEAMYYVHEMKDRAAYSSVVCGVETAEGVITGIYVASENRLCFVKCDFVIDATGDADVAVFSKCEYVPSGDRRDGMTQSYSIWGETEHNKKWTDSQYMGDDDNISTECYSEYCRGIFVTNVKNSPDGFSPMLTVRESRRIIGEYTLTLKDIMSERLFEDTVAVGLCLYDAHGVGSSRAYYTNLFTSLTPKGKYEDLRIRIPLRCLIPKRTRNIFVVSKAISATRDAGCLIRMNADVQNIAYSAGVIASHLMNSGTPRTNETLTEEETAYLKKDGILPEWYNKSGVSENLYNEICEGNLRAAAVASLDKSNEKLLVKGFETSDKPDVKYLFAEALAALGADKPFEWLLEKLRNLSENEEIINSHKDDVMSLCTLISNICCCNKPRTAEFVPVLKELIETITSGGGYGNSTDNTYTRSKVHNRTVPNFKTLLAVACAAERAADKSLAEPLLNLANSPYIRLEDGNEVFSVQLYLRLLAASARCASKTAVEELKKFENDEHLFFRSFVRRELESIDGNVCPLNDKWDMWI